MLMIGNDQLCLQLSLKEELVGLEAAILVLVK